MKKLIVLLLLSSCSKVIYQQKEGEKLEKALIMIKRCKTCFPQTLPGYVVKKDSCVTGYLTEHKTEFPKKIIVWTYTTVN